VARKKIGLQFQGWEEYISKLDELGGSTVVKKGVEEALIESKKHVNPLIGQSVARNKLPAGGKYSHGNTEQSIDEEMKVEWKGLTGEIKIGFDFSKSGVTSVFLMYGTPKMKPVAGLKNAIYGAKTQKEVAEIQEKILAEHIKKVMEG
jgi:hypothetical protein